MSEIVCSVGDGCITTSDKGKAALKALIDAAKKLDWSWRAGSAPDYVDTGSSYSGAHVSANDMSALLVSAKELGSGWSAARFHSLIPDAAVVMLRQDIERKTAVAPPTTSSNNTAASYNCTAAICYGVGTANHAKVVEAQQLINKFGGSAGFSAIAADGKIGDGTVVALNKVNVWLAGKGAWKAGTWTKQTIAAIATAGAGALAPMLRTAIAATSPRAAGSSGSTPRGGNSAPGVVPDGFVQSTLPPPPGTKAKLPPWALYAAAGLGGFLILALVYKRTSQTLAPGPAPTAA